MAYIPVYQVRIDPITQKPFIGEDGFEIVDLVGHTFVMDEHVPEIPIESDEGSTLIMQELIRLQEEYQNSIENP